MRWWWRRSSVAHRETSVAWCSIMTAVVLPRSSVAILLLLLLSITVLVRIITIRSSTLFFHDRAVVAVLRVRGISVLWLVHRIDPVKGAVLTARVGAVGPGSCAVRSVGDAGVDSIVRLVVAVLRIWALLVVDLRIRLHAVAVSHSRRRRPVLIAVIASLHLAVAIGAGAVVVACSRHVGIWCTLCRMWVLTTKVTAASAGILVVLVPLFGICIELEVCKQNFCNKSAYPVSCMLIASYIHRQWLSRRI
jgi:hypothetical protein